MALTHTVSRLMAPYMAALPAAAFQSAACLSRSYAREADQMDASLQESEKMKKKESSFSFWNPFSDFDVEGLFRAPYDGLFHQSEGQRPGMKNFPRVDIIEEGECLKIAADLPGMEKSDIQVLLERDNVLRICGRRHRELVEEDDDRHFRRVERHFGSFSRSINLPENVDKEDIGASFNNGVLRIELKKIASQDSRGTTIEIK